MSNMTSPLLTSIVSTVLRNDLPMMSLSSLEVEFLLEIATLFGLRF
jgi:hypothetical protein